MKKAYKCLVHGKFTADSTTSTCPRCLEMERSSVTDLKTEQSDMGEIQYYEGDMPPNRIYTVQPLKIEGRKDDQDKPDLSLLPKEALEAMARAFMHGEKKYGRYNYRAGMDWHRPLAAALRHLTAFNEGEDTDSESGVSHLGHALAAISMLIVYHTKGIGTDTRYKL